MDLPAQRRVIGAAALATALVAAAALSTSGDRAGASVAKDANVYAWTAGKLVRVHAATLRGTGRAVAVGPGPSAFSPDRRRLAVAGAIEPSVRIVDLARMRVDGPAVELGRTTAVDTLQWLDGSTIAVVTWGAPPRLLLIDVARRRIVDRRPLPGNVVARARARGTLVLLVGPHDRVGASSLLVVDAARGVRSVLLREIASGFAPTGASGGGDHRQVAPGLAVDPAGRRAIVVPPSGAVAEVDLASLRVRSHELTRRASLLGRLHDWLEPRAQAKSLSGPERHAFWVGGNAVAVAAVEQTGIEQKEGEHRQLARAVGVELIDAGDWSVRTLAQRAAGVAVTGETVLVYGGPFAAGGSFSADRGPAVTSLRGFTEGGSERFRLFPSRHVGHVETAGRYAYVTSPGAGAIDVVDVVTGRVVRTVRTREHVFVVAP